MQAPIAYLIVPRHNPAKFIRFDEAFLADDRNALESWFSNWPHEEDSADPFPWGFLPLPSGRFAVMQIVGRVEDRYVVRFAAIPSSLLRDIEYDVPRVLALLPSLPAPTELLFAAEHGQADACQNNSAEIETTAVAAGEDESSQLEGCDAATLKSLGVAVSCILNSPPTVVLFPADAPEWVMAVLQLLPGKCRQEMTICDWPLSEDAPRVRLVPLTESARLKLYRGAHSFLDLSEPLESVPDLPWSWGRLVIQEAARGGALAVEELMRKTPKNLAIDDLPKWVDDYLREQRRDAGEQGLYERADWIESIIRTSVTMVGPPTAVSTQDVINLCDEENVLERLDLLDEAAFNAITGGPEAVDTLRQLLPMLRDELSPELFEESRKQYGLQVIEKCEQRLQMEPDEQLATSLQLLRLLIA